MKQEFWNNITQKQRFRLLRKYRISKTLAFNLSQINNISELPQWLQNSGNYYFWDAKNSTYIY
ncbi:hypothetical protein LCGC14_0608730 [marine sediment metagenome]|uniref:Uncharacterized protein n=1 Tax=marine sediment metagenome TaxID=412755 RepID=A0A0F9RD92_9ZZZZ